jgi:hypothetical protein
MIKMCSSLFEIWKGKSRFFNSSHWIHFCFPIITYIITLYKQKKNTCMYHEQAHFDPSLHILYGEHMVAVVKNCSLCMYRICSLCNIESVLSEQILYRFYTYIWGHNLSLYVKRILCLVPVSVWSTNHFRTCIKHILFTFKIDRFKTDRSRTT